MPAETEDLQAMSDELDQLSDAAEAHFTKSEELGDEASEIGWDGEPEDAQKATALFSQSWDAYADYVRGRQEYHTKSREYDDAAGVLTEETTQLYDEIDELTAEWLQLTEACKDLCDQIAPLYVDEEDQSEQIDELWEQHDEKEARCDEIVGEIGEKQQEIEEKTPEPQDEEEDEE